MVLSASYGRAYQSTITVPDQMIADRSLSVRSPYVVAQMGPQTQNHESPAILTGDRMRTSRALIVALALPVSLAAQQPQGGANPVTTAFRGRTMAFQRNLAQAFDSIPESKFG